MERTRIEIDSELLETVRRMAREQDRDEREALEELVEESLRMRRFPGIVFHDGPAGRRAHVSGTGLDVWELVEMYQDMGRELLLESMSNVSEGKLEAALAYYEAYPEEIDAALERNRRPPEYWHRHYPETVPPPPESQ